MADEPADGIRPVRDRSAEALRTGLQRSGMSHTELWVGYLTLGGTLGEGQLASALQGDVSLTAHEHDTIAQALNDHFIDLGQDHPVPYFEDLERP